jgi:hypothetical protein
VILKFVDVMVGLRVSESEELAGLDASQHGETGYVFEEPLRVDLAEVKPNRTVRGAIDDILPGTATMET